MLFGSAVLVLGQFLTVIAINVGIVLVACENDDMCDDGEYCAVNPPRRCYYCGSELPLVMQDDGNGGTLNYPRDPDYVGFNLTEVREICTPPYRATLGMHAGVSITVPFSPSEVSAWCRNCIRNDGSVDPHNSLQLVLDNLGAMGVFDKLALWFCILIVSLTVVGELKDIELCSIAIQKAGDNIRPIVRFTMRLLNGIRRWAFLPGLVTGISLLVAVKGGGELACCALPSPWSRVFVLCCALLKMLGVTSLMSLYALLLICNASFLTRCAIRVFQHCRLPHFVVCLSSIQ
eukprot:COSAG06_NODE_1291_length_9980_cov_166.860237_6_plen_290_part_00